MALPKIEMRITVPTGGWSISHTDNDGGPTTRTLAAGDYFLTSTADGGSASLLGALKTLLDAGAGVTYTITLDDTADSATGKVTIVPSAGTFSITWTSTTFRDVLGFTANISAASTATGGAQAKYLWLPNVNRTPDGPDPASTTEAFGFEEADLIGTRSPSGVVTETVFNRRGRNTRLKFDKLLGIKTHKAHEVTTNESYQTFWRTYIDDGAPPWRYHPDRSSDANYWAIQPEAAQWNRFAPAPAIPNARGWVGARALFTVEGDVVPYVYAA